MDQCLFLTILPAEIRLRIYEHVLAFESPLKLRQVVAGSKNTGILRANRQIYSEALPVFYDVNTILATRNDFCLETGRDLQTPLRRDQVRHLLFKNISQSIRCSSFSGGNDIYLDGCCDVCRPDAYAFIKAVAALPRIRSVTVDYHKHQREFDFIKKVCRKDQFSQSYLQCIGMGKYKLALPSLSDTLSIIFLDMPLNTIWNEVAGHKFELNADRDPVLPWPLLDRLRDEVDKNLTETICFFLWPLIVGRGELPKEYEHIVSTLQDPTTDHATMEACVDAVLHYVKPATGNHRIAEWFAEHSISSREASRRDAFRRLPFFR